MSTSKSCWFSEDEAIKFIYRHNKQVHLVRYDPDYVYKTESSIIRIKHEVNPNSNFYSVSVRDRTEH